MREGPAKILQRVLDHVRRAEPWSCYSIDEISADDRKKVEAQLKEKFELWANSWVIPGLRTVIEKLRKKPKGEGKR